MPVRWPCSPQGEGCRRECGPVRAQVGVTDAVVRAAGACARLAALHMPDAFRVTDAGLAGLRNATALVRSMRSCHAPVCTDLYALIFFSHTFCT